MLLEQNDVDPDRADKSGRAPLSWLAANKDEGVKGMLPVLQQNDAHPNTADEGGQTLFLWAARLPPLVGRSCAALFLIFIFIFISVVSLNLSKY